MCDGHADTNAYSFTFLMNIINKAIMKATFKQTTSKMKCQLLIWIFWAKILKELCQILKWYIPSLPWHTSVNIWDLQRELFLSEVNNRETIAVIEAYNDMYCLQKWIEKFPLTINSIKMRAWDLNNNKNIFKIMMMSKLNSRCQYLRFRKEAFVTRVQ